MGVYIKLDMIPNHKRLKKRIDHFDELMYWDETCTIDEGLIEVITKIKEIVDDALTEKENSIVQDIEKHNEKGNLVKLLSQFIQNVNHLVLTRAAWNWIE